MQECGGDKKGHKSSKWYQIVPHRTFVVHQNYTAMSSVAQRFPSLITLLLVFALGGWAAWYFLTPKPEPVEQSAVLLEKIQAVCKLVTVEGQFSEVYSYNDYSGYFTFFWDKRMLLRVQAKVSAGYDFEKAKFEADPTNRVIRVSHLPQPEILSIDHTVDYYDISEGVFTSFTPQDYTRVNQRAKDLIREQAQKSTLLPAAGEQAGKILDIVRTMVESAGWQLEVDGTGAGTLKK
jgi:hypothetical protein